MTPDEKFNRDIWRMLKQVKNAQLHTSTRGKITLIPPDHNIKLILFDDNYDLTIDTQKKLLNKLEEWKVLNLVPDLTGDISFSLNNITRFTISLNQPKFDQIYNQYKYKYEESNDNNNEISKKNTHSFLDIETKIDYNNNTIRKAYKKSKSKKIMLGSKEGNPKKEIKQSNTTTRNTLQTKSQKKNRPDNISKIVLIRPKNIDGVWKYLINNDYKNTSIVRRASKRSKTLIEVIKDEVSTQFNKEIFDYFNYNKQCPLYFRGKYCLTSILEKEGDYLRINPAIKTEIIAEKTYVRRLEKYKQSSKIA